MNKLRTSEQLSSKLSAQYGDKRACGGILRVVRHGEAIFEDAAGYANIEKQLPITPESIFRIYSMTKTVTMTALMQLYERGLIYPEDRLTDFFPEFSAMPVAAYNAANGRPDGGVALKKPSSPVTVRQLATMTSGFPYPGTNDFGELSFKLIDDEYAGGMDTLENMMTVFAKKGVLCFEPGTQWRYGLGHDVIGAIIERASGMTLDEYFRRYIFEPLNMIDTGFYVPKDKRERFVTAYHVEKGEYVPYTKEFTDCFLTPPKYLSGGGGLVSTLEDMSRFCEMLLGFGEYKGERLLGRKTVELMATNQLSDEQMKTFVWRERGYGYGVGMRTLLHPWTYNAGVGEFGWDGMMGTWLSVDPKNDMYTLYMVNQFPYSDCGQRLMPIIYAGIE